MARQAMSSLFRIKAKAKRKDISHYTDYLTGFDSEDSIMAAFSGLVRDGLCGDWDYILQATGRIKGKSYTRTIRHFTKATFNQK